jgi:hypothetical protein
MAMETEVEIEILGLDMDIEKYDGLEEFGTVSRYDRNTGAFVPGYLQSNVQVEEMGPWMENL